MSVPFRGQGRVPHTRNGGAHDVPAQTRRPGSARALDRVVDEQAVGADVCGVDVRLVGSARAGLRPEMELAYAGPDEPRDLLGAQPSAGHQEWWDPLVASRCGEEVVEAHI